MSIHEKTLNRARREKNTREGWWSGELLAYAML